MTNDEKAKLYDNLLFEYGKLGNQIQLIKGEDIEMKEHHLVRIEELKRRQNIIMAQLQRLMS